MPASCRHALPVLLMVAGMAAAEPRASADACADLSTTQPVTLAEYIDRSLCANPDTRAAWQRIRTQRAQVGIAEAAWYPTLNVTASQSRSFAPQLPGASPNQTRYGLTSDWLLWDFGGRGATIRQTRLTLEALQATQAATSRATALTAVQAWYARLSAAATLAAADDAVNAAEQTARAARERQQVGSGTRADLLQAETALAQARLNRIQLRGNLASADGQLAVIAGYPADRQFRLATQIPTPQDSPPVPSLDVLLAQARDTRPERQAQLLQVRAASADLDRITAQARPRLSLSTARGELIQGGLDRSATGQVALNATLPLFTGFQQRNQEAAGASQVSQQEIELARIDRQISLDVWQAWQSLATATASLSATDALLASAQESWQAALARYQAGLGNLLTVLSAQSARADALQQQAGARYNWAAARLALAAASGILVRQPDTPFPETTP